MPFIIFLIILVFISSGCSSSKEAQTAEQRKAEIYYTQGTSDLVNEDYTSALSNLYQAVELDADNPKIHNNLGMAYYFKGHKNLAIIHIKKSAELDPKNSEAHNNLASIYFELKQYDDAEKEFKIIQQDMTYPFQYQILFSLGLIEQQRGKQSEAIQYFQKSLKENPQYCRAYFNLGQISLQNQNYSEAQQNFFKASLGECYKEPGPQYFQGLTLTKLRKWIEARTKFEEVVERFPSSPYSEMAQKEISQIKQKLDGELFTKKEKSDKKSNNIYQSPIF